MKPRRIAKRKREREAGEKALRVLTRSPLAELRYAAGFRSAVSAAAKIGCSPHHLFAVEQGRKAGSWEMVSAMMAAYGVTERQLRVAMRKARRELLKRELNLLREEPCTSSSMT